MKIASEPVDALVQLGYTPEEAQFVYLVAIHSGYFTHRQFFQFAGTKPGKHSQKFLDKLLAQKHATAHTYQSGARVYHVFSRKVFQSIGHENLRTRRKHQLDYIKTRLMALDFVLANPEHHYLETEGDKVPFFVQRMQVSPSFLPSRTYTSKVSTRSTVRYFVDRFPLYIKDGVRLGLPVVTFTYLDPGFTTVQGFATHLRAYAGLFQSLPKFELIYIAPSERPFSDARLEFSRILQGASTHPSKENLFRYFALRKLWEAGGRVEAADVVYLNAVAKSPWHGEALDSLYRKWCAGAAAEADVRLFLHTVRTSCCGEISTVIGGASLSIFQQRQRQANATDGETPLSPRVSPQD